MKAFSLATAVIALSITLTGCSSAQRSGTSARASDAPMVFSSARSPRSIANCLSSRLAGVDRRMGAGYTELGLGRSANGYAWLVTLKPSAVGSNVTVEKVIDNDSVSEPELRFAIARCTT
ncbi:hypothetical protein [Trinickia soli]|uniref:hypothetical protein n=1 Tax=Trinickia soli TaxID=380675 RepID=UPI003FA35200